MNRKLMMAIGLMMPALAFAHPGHTDNLMAAFSHPFTGVDHLFMMLCVGIFAGRMGGNARWQLPLVFLMAMTAGWVLAAAGYVFAGIESGIAAGLIALGALFVWQINMPRVLHIGIVSFFAMLHGMAHGVELSSTAPFATSVGFLLATAGLHALGVAIAALIPVEKQNPYRAVGIALSALGGGLLLAA